MEYLKKFNESSDDLKDRIGVLENAILKRNKLIYLMIKKGVGIGAYQNFMLDKSVNIDELCVRYKVDEIEDKNFIKNRINLLNNDIENEIE